MPGPWGNLLPNKNHSTHQQMLTGKSYAKYVKHLCIYSDEKRLIYQLLPYWQNQDNTRKTCKILKGLLAYPITSDAYHNSKYRERKV